MPLVASLDHRDPVPPPEEVGRACEPDDTAKLMRGLEIGPYAPKT